MGKFSRAMQLSWMFSSFVKQFLELMVEIKLNLTNIQILLKELPRKRKQGFSIFFFCLGRSVLIYGNVILNCSLLNLIF